MTENYRSASAAIADASDPAAMDMQVWNGAVEILAAAKAVPFEHRFDAFAVAFDAFVRTSGTIDVDYPEDRLDALWCLAARREGADRD